MGILASLKGVQIFVFLEVQGECFFRASRGVQIKAFGKLDGGVVWQASKGVQLDIFGEPQCVFGEP